MFGRPTALRVKAGSTRSNRHVLSTDSVCFGVKDTQYIDTNLGLVEEYLLNVSKHFVLLQLRQYTEEYGL